MNSHLSKLKNQKYETISCGVKLITFYYCQRDDFQEGNLKGWLFSGEEIVNLNVELEKDKIQRFGLSPVSFALQI